MRTLTDEDFQKISGITTQGYHVEYIRVKHGSFTDSDHYGIILGKNARGHFVTYQFHLDETEMPAVYWGHYFLDNREAAIHDFNNRDRNVSPD